MAIDLTDKSIIITGASSGIGAATAIECAKAGMNVVINARRADRLRDVADKVEKLGQQVEIVAGDVAEDGLATRMLDATYERFGTCYAVFANAGYGLEKAIHEMSSNELRDIFDVNFFASVDLIRTAAQRLIADQSPGHLLMCSSCLSKFTLPYYSAYSATKAAQNHICNAMNIELREHGIHVSSVNPITTVTEFHKVAMQQSGRSSGGINIPDHTPGMFVQSPRRVARAIVRCLQRPHSEVWTSHIVRFAAALMTWSPGFMDRIMRRMADKHRPN